MDEGDGGVGEERGLGDLAGFDAAAGVTNVSVDGDVGAAVVAGIVLEVGTS